MVKTLKKLITYLIGISLGPPLYDFPYLQGREIGSFKNQLKPSL